MCVGGGGGGGGGGVNVNGAQEYFWSFASSSVDNSFEKDYVELFTYCPPYSCISGIPSISSTTVIKATSSHWLSPYPEWSLPGTGNKEELLFLVSNSTKLIHFVTVPAPLWQTESAPPCNHMTVIQNLKTLDISRFSITQYYTDMAQEVDILPHERQLRFMLHMQYRGGRWPRSQDIRSYFWRYLPEYPSFSTEMLVAWLKISKQLFLVMVCLIEEW